MSYSNFDYFDYDDTDPGFPIFGERAPDDICHKMMGLVCPDDKPPMFGALVHQECLPVGTFSHPYHRQRPSTGIKLNCGPQCNTAAGCVCNLKAMTLQQPVATLPLLNPIYPRDATIFVD